MTERYLESYNDVFADIVNVLLFAGEKKVKPEELASDGTRTIYKAEGNLHEQDRDIAKYWAHGKTTFCLLGFENQTKVERNMPLRVIGYDGAAYRAQLNEKRRKYPVVSLILYFGTERRWGGPKTLKKCLRIPSELEPYVNDYRIQVFNIAFLTDEQVAMFESDFRIVADYFVQVRKNKEYIPSKETIKHVDAVLKLMSVLTNDYRFEEILHEEREVKTMSEVLDKVEKRGERRGEERGEKRGMEEGIKQGIEYGERAKLLQLVEKKLKKGQSIEQIADALEETPEYIRELMKKIV